MKGMLVEETNSIKGDHRAKVSMSAFAGFVSMVLTWFMLAGLFQAAPIHAAERANVLFIIADDFCYQNIAALGHTDIDTPNLDRLIKRGTTFTRAYNMGSFSGAVCVASRAMLITGRSLWRASALYNQMDQERQAGRLWPQIMAEQGYDTYFTGKWHIQTDAAKVFHVTRAIRPGMPKETQELYNRPLTGQIDPWAADDSQIGGFWEGGRHWSETVADDVDEFFGLAKKSENPFFMYVAFNAPHDPRQSPRSYLDKYPLDRIAVPSNFAAIYPYAEEMGCGPTLRDEKLAPFPRTEYAVKVHRREYYAIISHLDTQIGRILDTLDRSGRADNTYVVFTADHGLAVGQHGLMGKQNLYDHSVRVPFILAGPAVPQDAKVQHPIFLQDAMATSLAIAGSPQIAEVEFQNLLPVAAGKNPSLSRDAVYGAYLKLQRAVTHDGWKLILYPKANAVRLYHLSADPDERHDLAGDPANASRIRSLFQQLRRLQQDFADPLDLVATYPNYASANNE